MRLHSGLPYWIIKDQLYDYYNPLREDIYTDVAIIGAGITGALAAHALCKAGLECCVIDRRSIATGSSAASTALLQYEIDTPLHILADKIGEENAAKAYHACLNSISDLERILQEAGIEAGFERRPSIFYASDHNGEETIMKEFEIRKRHGLPVEMLSRKELHERFGINTPGGALFNRESAQVDVYKAASSLLAHDMKNSGLRVFTHTDITGYEQDWADCCLTERGGHTIRCRYAVIASGFEAGQFLPEKVMKLTSTYALVSHPVERARLWPEEALIWETAQPYIYMRTAGNRIIMGGEDENFSNPRRRDRKIGKKVAILESRFRELFPDIPFRTEMAWCGTFSSTDDGLPFIGPWDEGDRVYFDLGYGGNGITFSVIGSQIISRSMTGYYSPDDWIFGFGRVRKQTDGR